MGGPSLSPVFLKHKIPSWVEEITKIEENVANGSHSMEGFPRDFCFKSATAGNRAGGGTLCRNGTTQLLTPWNTEHVE